MNIIPYTRHWVDDNDIKEVVKVLKTGWITQGPKIDEFEQAIAKYCQAKYAVAFSSGTGALHAAYAIAGISKEGEAITTPLTFAATANTILYCGGKPVFVDIEPDILTINPALIKKAITSKTKAIAPVDFAGHPCNYDAILKIAKDNNLLVIEDASHALGSLYKRKKIGSFADMTIFSFHPAKAITTGEGGMVVTNNRDFYKKLKIFRHHGMIKKSKKGPWYYEIETVGHNFRITDFQCALGLSQFKKLNKFITKRRKIVAQYNTAFKDIEEIILPIEKNWAYSSWHIYSIQLRLEKLRAGRRKIFESLQQNGLGVQVHYMPVHLHPLYKNKYGYKAGDFPIAENYYQRAITLPLFPKMTDKDVSTVIKTVKKVINENESMFRFATSSGCD